VQLPYGDSANPVISQMVSLLQKTALFLWKDWPMDMNFTLLDYRSGIFTLNGVCPHCAPTHSLFTIVGVPCIEPSGVLRGHQVHRVVAVMRCQACLEYILGIALFDDSMNRADYQEHYPLGTANDEQPEEIPPDIASDFSEALRCRWVDAYNATVEMCRRALEASCLQLGADPTKLTTLERMIVWVHEQGTITKPLCDMAHKIRLGGDRGAHPSARVMGEEDADAVIEFTREYFDAVYVMPARMAKFDFSRPKQDKPETK